MLSFAITVRASKQRLHCSAAGCDHLAGFGVRTLTLDFAPAPDVLVWLVEFCSEAAFAKALGGIITGSPVIAIGRSGRTEEIGGATGASTRSDALATPSVDGVVAVWANSGPTGLPMQTADAKAAAAAILTAKSGRSGSFLGMADVLGIRTGFQLVNVMPSSQFRNSLNLRSGVAEWCAEERKSIADNDRELKRVPKLFQPQTEKGPAPAASLFKGTGSIPATLIPRVVRGDA
jgi:hypothetical protein